MEISRKAFRKVIKEDDEKVLTDEEMKKLLNYVPDALKNVLDKLRMLTGDKEYMLSYADGRNMKTLKVRQRLYAVCEELGVRKKSRH